MKRIVSIIFLSICFSASSFAQWRVIYPNEKYNYLISSQSDSIIRTTIWVDSSKIENGDSVFYLNKVFRKAGFTGANEVLLINQSQFLKSKITLSVNNIQHIEGDKSWYVNGNCNVGDSWIFDNTTNKTAYCDSIFEMNFFGIIDSVKRIEVDTTDTILLSKYYGLISFPDFDTLNRKFNLVGLEIQNIGLIVPKAYSFCNFNVGDEFEFQVSYTFIHDYPFQGIHDEAHGSGFNRYIIQSKTLTADSVIYQIKNRYSILRHSYPPSSDILDIDTGSIDTIAFVLNNIDDSINSQFNSEYSVKSVIAWCIFEADTLSTGYSKHFYSNNFSKINNSDSIIIGSTGPSYYNFEASSHYSEKVGLYQDTSDYFYIGVNWNVQGNSKYKKISAYTINGIQYGQYQPDSIYHDCRLDAIYNNYIESDKDTLIDADSTVLRSHFVASSYLWFPGGEITDTITVYEAGIYWLTVTDSFGCHQSSSKHIYSNYGVYHNSITASSLFQCDSSEIVLASKIDGFHFLWSTGITASSINVNAPGQYCLTTTDAYGFSSVKCVTITNIRVIPFDWPDDTVINRYNNVTLQIPSMYSSNLWSDGNTNAIRTFNADNLNFGVNKVWAIADKDGCTASDTILIILNPGEDKLEENFYNFFSIENGVLNLIPTIYGCTYELYSIDGKLIFKDYSEGGSGTKSLYLKSLNTGIYFLRITTSQKSYTGKVFISY